MSFSDEEKDEINRVTYKPFLIIEEEPELQTDIEFIDFENSSLITKLMIKFTKGYKFRTILALSLSFLNILFICLPSTFILCGLFPILGIYIFVFLNSLLMSFLVLKVILKTNKLDYSYLVHTYIGKKTGIFFDICNIFYHLLNAMIYQALLFYTILYIIQLYLSKEKTPEYNWTQIVSFCISNLIVIILLRCNKLINFNFVTLAVTVGICTIFLYLLFNIRLSILKKNYEYFFFIGKHPQYYFYSFGVTNVILCSHSRLFDKLSQFILRTTKRTKSVFMWSKTIECVITFILLFLSFLSINNNPDILLVILFSKKILATIIRTTFLPIMIFLTLFELSSIENYFLKLFIKKSKHLSILVQLGIEIFVLALSDISIYFQTNIFSIMGILAVFNFFIFYFIPTKLYSKMFQDRRWKYYLSHFLTIINFLVMLPLLFISICHILHIYYFDQYF